ncbi:glycosyltransferase [Patescibacteria group bacterium]|nr:glycosyltransferase [Patescibacteria group bacterium]
MNKKPFFSIIIPVIKETPYLSQTRKKLNKQIFKNFELLVISNKISKTSNPALKRNLGAKMAKGKYLAFLDDDSYPHKNWLANAKKQFDKNPNITALCGPCLTPPEDNIFQQASGLIWSSFLGSGGAGDYRNHLSPPRFVDDYPTVNLIVNKSDFDKIGGFQTRHWPGEDTVLCLDLTRKLGKKIFYHPSIVVFHHRRAIFLPHLRQLGRYAKMRGLFVKKYPATSARPGYFLPSLFLIYLLYLLFRHPVCHPEFISGSPWTLLPLYLYLTLLLITFLLFLKNRHSLLLSLLATITIPVTHLYYGFFFILGLLS